MIRKLIGILLIAGIIAVILFLALLNPHETWQLSYSVQQFLIKLFHQNHQYLPRWVSDLRWLRIIAHIPIYFILGLIVRVFLFRGGTSALVCFGVSLLEETLKFFLPTREFGWIDLGFDALGYLFGVLLIELYSRWHKGRYKRRDRLDLSS